MGENARKFVLSNHGYEKLADEFSLILSILKKKVLSFL